MFNCYLLCLWKYGTLGISISEGRKLFFVIKSFFLFPMNCRKRIVKLIFQYPFRQCSILKHCVQITNASVFSVMEEEVKPCLQCRVCGSTEAGERGWTATSLTLPSSGRTVDEFIYDHLLGHSPMHEIMLCCPCFDLVVESDKRFFFFLESLHGICSRNPSTCEFEPYYQLIEYV